MQANCALIPPAPDPPVLSAGNVNCPLVFIITKGAEDYEVRLIGVENCRTLILKGFKKGMEKMKQAPAPAERRL